MNTYILSSYAALQTVDHADIASIVAAVKAHGGNAVALPQTVIATMTPQQYARFNFADTPMADDANTLELHKY